MIWISVNIITHFFSVIFLINSHLFCRISIRSNIFLDPSNLIIRMLISIIIDCKVIGEIWSKKKKKMCVVWIGPYALARHIYLGSYQYKLILIVANNHSLSFFHCLNISISKIIFFLLLILSVHWTQWIEWLEDYDWIALIFISVQESSNQIILGSEDEINHRQLKYRETARLFSVSSYSHSNSIRFFYSNPHKTWSQSRGNREYS